MGPGQMLSDAGWPESQGSTYMGPGPGDKQIENTSSYKYLGDVVTNDNKNKANLETRENKVAATVRQINTTAS